VGSPTGGLGTGFTGDGFTGDIEGDAVEFGAGGAVRGFEIDGAPVLSEPPVGALDGAKGHTV
jgi:hypothetical protein